MYWLLSFTSIVCHSFLISILKRSRVLYYSVQAFIIPKFAKNISHTFISSTKNQQQKLYMKKMYYFI